MELGDVRSRLVQARAGVRPGSGSQSKSDPAGEA
jgi:hypothetical protein